MEPPYGWFNFEKTYVVGYYCSFSNSCVVYKPGGFCNQLAKSNGCDGNLPDCHRTKFEAWLDRVSLTVQKSISKWLRPFLSPFLSK